MYRNLSLQELNENKLQSLNLCCNFKCCHRMSCSLNAGNDIGIEGVVKLAEALKSNTSLASLDLSCNNLMFGSFSLYTGCNIGTKGVTKLSEALESNSSLNSLNLSCNVHVASLILIEYR
jgi:hypothetical protein